MKSISIVIATYNAGNLLTKCIESIILQKDEKIEIIIIDGGSKDNTIEIINNYKSYLGYWISEPDEGVYDAWNKGVTVAQSDWIMFLGSDDLLLPGALNSYIQFINENGTDFDIISSRLDYTDKRGTHLKYVVEPWDWAKFIASKMSFAHPGMLHNANMFLKYGLFDVSFKICGDSEFLLRTQGKIKAGFIDEITVEMQQGGISDSIKAIREAFLGRKKNNSISLLQNYMNFTSTFIIFIMSKIKRKIYSIVRK